LVPVVLLAYHFGPGQSRLTMDRAARKIADARALELKEDWQGAYEAWSAALAATPQDKTTARLQLQLAQARTRMYTGELPEAMEDMDKLLTEAQRVGADKNFQHEVRGTLATAQYYAGWLMRLEGAPAEEWLHPVESARQNFRLLAEETKDVKAAVDYEKNLEATIRLARMDLSELQGMPLPKFCSGCKNVSQKCRSQCQSKAEAKAEPEKKDARGAGFNDIPKGGS
jgi:tetratricopeptide (TPR) repeat protein